MFDWLIPVYPGLKSVHIVAVISWMAGLLYLPRLFVYHCTVAPGSEASETFKVMERKLSRLIMFPAAVASAVFGLAILFVPGYLASAGIWLWTKLALVVVLAVVHYRMVCWREDFAADRNERPERFFRFMNEVPTLLMIAIVILVVIRPF